MMPALRICSEKKRKAYSHSTFDCCLANYTVKRQKVQQYLCTSLKEAFYSNYTGNNLTQVTDLFFMTAHLER